MNAADSVSTGLKKYVVFTGRASRSEYWWFVLFLFLALVASNFVHEMLGVVVYLALVLPMLAVGVRRLHDIGKSGWFLLIGLIPLIGALVLLYFHVQPSDVGSNDYGEAPTSAG